MFAWSHTSAPILGVPIGAKGSWAEWATRTGAYQYLWGKGDAEGLRALLCFSLLVVADLTQTPPVDRSPTGNLVLPALDDSTVYRTKLGQALAAAILHTWRVLWAVTGTPEDRPLLFKGLSTTGGELGKPLGQDVGWLTNNAQTVIAHGDLGHVCALAQLAPAILERSLANDASEAKPFRDAACVSLGSLHALLGAHYRGVDDDHLEELRKALLDADMRLIGIAPRQRGPVLDDAPAPSPAPLPLPTPEPPASDGGGALLLLALAAYLILEGT